jgi:hypothetical protein
VISYAGAMGFGFTTARAAVPDAHRLTQALAEAFEELLVKTRKPPPQPERRDDALPATPPRNPR